MASSLSILRAADIRSDVPDAEARLQLEKEALQRTLAAVEQRYRLAVESAELGIWDFDPMSGRLDWDARCRALFGLSPTARVDQEVFLGAVHPDDRPRIEAAMASALDPAGHGRYEVEHRSIGVEDGVERWIGSQGQTIFEGGRATRFIGTLRDITARKRAESAQLAAVFRAEAHRARLHRLFMEAPAVISILRGPDHVFELANASYLSIVGDERELMGRPIREAIPELAAGRILTLLDHVYATGEPFYGVEVKSVFGRRLVGAVDSNAREDAYFDLVFQPTFDHEGRIDGVLQISFDVTDRVLARRRAEQLTEQLRPSEERYRSLVKAMTQTVWITTPDGQLRGDQPGWMKLTGQSHEEVQGDGWLTAVHPDDRARTVAAWETAIRSEEVFACEHRVRRHDGVWRHFMATGAPVRAEDGSIREWFGIHTDVTQEKLVEGERERLIAELKRSNEDLDHFAYVTSHDLKAPLRGIANLSQWVEEDLAEKISEEGRRQMRLLRGRVHRLEALINGILRYSRAGRIRERLERVDVSKLAREVVELLAPPPGVHFTFADDLPTFEGERAPLQQVLMNLVGNALRHAKKSDPRVAIACSPASDGYSFMVKDNGPGIAPAFHQRIWVIFQTLEPRDKVEATGVGLSIVKKIVESRGGHVWIESVPGAGAEFHFSWPAHSKAHP